MLSLEPTDLFLRLGLAIALGAMLGLERELQGKDAGLRTHMMIALGACSFTLVTIDIAYDAAGEGSQLKVDPLRIIEGVIGGIGFLAAGQIIEGRGSGVEGITTAAGIWVIGGIGVACGSGQLALATSTALLSMLILSSQQLVERVRRRAAKKAEKGEGGAGRSETPSPPES